MFVENYHNRRGNANVVFNCTLMEIKLAAAIKLVYGITLEILRFHGDCEHAFASGAISAGVCAQSRDSLQSDCFL